MNFLASLLAVVVGVLSGFFKKPTLSSTLARSKFATYREVWSSEAAKRLLWVQAIPRVGLVGEVSRPEELVISGT